MIKDRDNLITNVTEIANNLFVLLGKKLIILKEKIDKTQAKELLEKLKDKAKKLRFTLKEVTESKVKRAMDERKKKKSSGEDMSRREYFFFFFF